MLRLFVDFLFIFMDAIQDLKLVEVPLAISRADSKLWRGMLKAVSYRMVLRTLFCAYFRIGQSCCKDDSLAILVSCVACLQTILQAIESPKAVVLLLRPTDAKSFLPVRVLDGLSVA